MKKEVSNFLVLICFVVSIATFQGCLKEADLPVVITTEVSNIKTQSALFGGNVTDDGGTVVDLRGVCWGTANNPTIAGSKEYYWHGTGSFTFIVTGLTPNTYYHVRAFAINKAGTAYGNEVHFTTKQIIAPKVTTIVDTLSRELTSIKARGNITCNDETYVLKRGFCWATTAYPNTNNNIFHCGEGPGSFEGNLYPLQPGTVYYVRAYAETIAGITYGNEIQFKTQALPDIATDPVKEFSRTTARVSGKLFLHYDPQLYWSVVICSGKTSGPTINGYSVSIDSLGNDGVFTCTLTNLIPGTLYYVRACWYAVDWFDDTIKFIQYGNEVTFTTNQ